MVSMLISLLILCLVLGLIFWLIQMLPNDARFKQAALIIFVIIAIIVLLRFAFPGVITL